MDPRPLQDIADKIILIKADLNDYNSVYSALRNISPDYICHLGALTPVRLSFERPFEFEQTNFKGTMNIIHAILDLPDFKTRQLIFASTAEVYGWQKENKPYTEDLPLNPASPYAVSKAAADMYIRMAMEVYNLNSTILRPTNSYGRKFETGFIVEYLITSMIKNNKPYIGTPDSIRDYMYVQDHVNAYVECIENPKSQGQVFNVSTCAETSNKQLAEVISRLLGYKGEIVYGSYPPNYPTRPQIADPPYLVLNNQKIQSVLKWKPKFSLEDGLKKAIEYWNNFYTK